MRQRIALACATAVAVAVALITAPASAVVNGQRDDGDAYPYVGTLIISVPTDSTPPVAYHYWCSGTIVSPKVFLTAGHCFDQAFLESVFGVGSEVQGMTLDADASGFMTELPASLRTGQGFKAPGWPGKSSKLDVGVYVLDESVDISPIPTLPTAGQLDRMHLTGQQATIVGYGMTRDRTGGRNGFSDLGDGYRTYAAQRITAVTGTTLHLLGNIAAGGSGPCAGDSGAPRIVDLDGSPTIVAISHSAGPYCQTQERALRLDTETILDFIHGKG